jgi:L-threonylcarbamoyladenylate synthase
MKTSILPANDSKTLIHAVDILARHGVVAFPTDTVYGLAARVFDTFSVDMLYGIKGREHTKAIAVLLSDVGQLQQVTTSLTPQMRLVAETYWPGPLTLIVPRHPNVPDIVSKTMTLGVRIPDHPVARQLINLAGPLAVTSANLSGDANTVTAEEVVAQLNGRIDLVVDGGRTPGGVPSTVIDCVSETMKIVREGPITMKMIKKTLKKGGFS